MIALQSTLCPELPDVINNIDYQNQMAILRRIDEILRVGKIDECYIEMTINHWLNSREQNQEPRAQDFNQFTKTSQWGFRAMLLKSLMGYRYRELSVQLAQCPLYRWFCRMEMFGPIKSPGKSSLQEWAQRLPVDQMQLIIDHITATAAAPCNPLELKNQIELDTVWMDSTCLKANIHFPVDWVLLRDAVRTLIKGVTLIRDHGIKHRMNSPESFMNAMNRLSIEMTHSRRKADSKKQRKKVLRKMKELCQTVRSHARRHRDLLEQRWSQTDWSHPQALQVIARMDRVLEQLPKAIEQAHERIIGERQVKSNEKILSLYDSDVNVIVRGKAGSEVEFGNKLFLAENSQGLIVDWKLYRDSAPSDDHLVEPSLERMEQTFGEGVVRGIVGDRGFDSADNEQLLAEKGMFNGLFSRDPVKMKVRTMSKLFQQLQTRRAQTEARIAIMTNDFAGTPMLSKGFERRERKMSWHILTHNLWVLARIEQTEEQETSRPLESAA